MTNLHSDRVALERLNLDESLKNTVFQNSNDGLKWIHTGYWMKDILGFWYEAEHNGIKRWFKGMPRGI